MTIERIMLAGAGLLALSACTPNDIGFGAATKASYAAQIVDPEPAYAGPMAAGGDQIAAAQERYRKGNVKKAKAIRTTNGSQSGSGSSN